MSAKDKLAVSKPCKCYLMPEGCRHIDLCKFEQMCTSPVTRRRFTEHVSSQEYGSDVSLKNYHVSRNECSPQFTPLLHLHNANMIFTFTLQGMSLNANSTVILIGKLCSKRSGAGKSDLTTFSHGISYEWLQNVFLSSKLPCVWKCSNRK